MKHNPAYKHWHQTRVVAGWHLSYSTVPINMRKWVGTAAISPRRRSLTSGCYVVLPGRTRMLMAVRTL